MPVLDPDRADAHQIAVDVRDDHRPVLSIGQVGEGTNGVPEVALAGALGRQRVESPDALGERSSRGLIDACGRSEIIRRGGPDPYWQCRSLACEVFHAHRIPLRGGWDLPVIPRFQGEMGWTFGTP